MKLFKILYNSSKTVKYFSRKESFMSNLSNLSNINLEKNPILPQKQQIINKDIRKELLKSVKNIENIENSQKREVFFNKLDASNYYKHLNSDFGSFFQDKEFNLENFNYLVQIQSKKNQSEQIKMTIQKMKELGINPNIKTYLHLLNSYSSIGLIKESEDTFKLIEENFTPTIFIYNSLMLAYAKNGKADECESILNEVKKKGLEPDLAFYTTLINAHDRNGDFGRCWEIYYNLSNLNEDLVKEFKNKIIVNKNTLIPIRPLIEDEYLTSYMIRLCEKTHDAERAVNLFKKMEIKGYVPSILHFNSIIFALASRKAYAQEALDMFTKMKMLKITPNLTTFTGVLKACHLLGDIYTANEVVKEIKYLGLEINTFIVTGLIRTYAGAVLQPQANEDHVKQYIQDSWKLLEYAELNNLVINAFTLNAILEVHCNALKWEEVDGLVIPLFEKYNIKLDVHSFDQIMNMMLTLRNFNALIQIYNQMLDQNIEPNQNILNYLLETGIKTQQTEIIVDSLRLLKQKNRNAKTNLLNTLSKVEDLPDAVYVELKYWNNELSYKWTRKLSENRRTKVRTQYDLPRIKNRLMDKNQK